MPQTTTATTLFGRHDELGRAEHDLAVAHSGLPRVLVVSGESGVGKTTLCRNVLARHDGLSLTGHCLPLEGDSVPFAPLIGTLRGLARHLGEPGLQGLERWWPRAFSALLPQEARTAMEGSSPDDELTNSAQARLFEGLLTLLEQLSSAVPVAWLVEDVHWADRSTLDLLTFLAGSLDSGRVLLVITVRTDDLGPEHPTRRWLHELSRLPSVGRLYLTRLGRAATHQQLRALAGADGNAVDASVLDAVFDRSAGNPLFTEELFPWTSDPAQPLPQSLHEMITSRLAVLPADVGPLLEVAAVLGSEVDLDLIRQVAGLDEATAEQAVRTAVDRHLLRESAEGTYAFVHPVFREVLETTMLRARRRRLHAAAADALAARCTQPAGFEITARIAHHWEVAGKAGPAYAAAIQAGLAAEQLCAFAEADASFSRAVELGARDDVDQADSGLTPAALLLHAARAAHLVGDDDRAVSITERALQVTDDAAARSEVLERQGMYCFNAGRVEEGNAAFAEALALLPDEPTHARARVLSGIGLLAMGWTRVDEAVRACREAITVARAVGAPKEEGRALNALGVVTAVQGELDEGIALIRQAVSIAEQLDAPDDLSVGYINLTHLLSLAGQCDEALAAYERGYSALSRVGLQRQDGSFLQANVAEGLIRAGRWDEAAGLLEQALAQRPRGIRAFPVLEHAARLSLQRGELERAQTLVDSAHSLLDETAAPDSWRRELLEVEAELLLEQNQPEPALAVAEAGLALVAGGDEARFAGPLAMLAARALADLNDTSPAPPDATEAVRTFRTRLSAMRPSPLTGASHPLPAAVPTELTLRAELARGEHSDEVLHAWRDAAEAWEAIDRPYPAAYARWRDAEVQVLTKQQGERPVAAVRTAHGAASSLGAAGLVREVELLAQWGRIDLVAEAVPVDATDEQGLTAREVDVLEGLMAGRTNREIGATLFISVKTVSVHVSNILRKLGVASREEAARIGHRRGRERQ